PARALPRRLPRRPGPAGARRGGRAHVSVPGAPGPRPPDAPLADGRVRPRRPDPRARARPRRRDRRRALRLLAHGRLCVLRLPSDLPAASRPERAGMTPTAEQTRILGALHGSLRIAAGAG